MNYDGRPAYIAPYAAGAGLALSLLFTERVSEVYLNDFDPAVHAFWQSVLEHTPDMLALVRRTPVTVREWEKQRETYASGPQAGPVALGFATFFLNRTNHSGILNGGPIGGKDQTGPWKIDARFNGPVLVDRIARIGAAKTLIHFINVDALEALRRPDGQLARFFLYLDPPYYRTGRALYLNGYSADGSRSGSRRATGIADNVGRII